MATLSAGRTVLLGGRRRGMGFSKESASPLWAIVAWIVGILVFFPVLYMFLTGFKSENAAVELPPKLIFWPTLENYQAVFGINFVPYFRNSIITSLVSTFFVMLLAIPCAYALALYRPKKWKDVLFFFISTRFLPVAGVIVPLYVIFSPTGDPDLGGRGLSLLGTLQGLIILYTAMNLPIAVWMLRSFFEEIPRDVLDAARVDGAGLFREMTQIVLPMVAPGLVATIFIAIIFAWNEFFLAYNLAPKESTVPMFMVRFVTAEGLFWAKLAASCTMAVLPIVIIGWLAQKQLVRGLSLGAVK